MIPGHIRDQMGTRTVSKVNLYSLIGQKSLTEERTENARQKQIVHGRGSTYVDRVILRIEKPSLFSIRLTEIVEIVDSSTGPWRGRVLQRDRCGSDSREKTCVCWGVHMS